MNNIYGFNLYKYKHDENGNIVLEPFDPQEIIICGRKLEDVTQILNGLDLEKEKEMTLTMNNLGKWCELVRNDIEKQQREAVKRFIESVKEQE